MLSKGDTVYDRRPWPLAAPGAALLAAALLLATGCALLPAPAAKQPPAPPAADAAPRDALPPRKAAKACLATAESLHRSGHLERAAALYRRAREYDPDLPVAHALAAALDAMGEDGRAEAEYQRALVERPHDADLLNNYGYFHFSRGRPADAERWFRRALAQERNHPQAQTNLALALGAQGRFEESLAAFTDAVGPAAAYSNLGVMLAKAGRHGEATAAFVRARDLDPNLPQPTAFLDYLRPEP